MHTFVVSLVVCGLEVDDIRLHCVLSGTGHPQEEVMDLTLWLLSLPVQLHVVCGDKYILAGLVGGQVAAQPLAVLKRWVDDGAIVVEPEVWVDE